jgi:NAD(P) transhydrogenase subunit alpha
VHTTPAASKPAELAKPAEAAKKPRDNATNSLIFGVVAVGALLWASRYLPSEFLQHLTVFILACFVGWQVVWAVTPALHTPLMSVTNAISGIIVIGGMLQIGTELSPAAILGVVAVLVATINIAGGFLVTQRMLKMFRREEPAPARGGHS